MMKGRLLCTLLAGLWMMVLAQIVQAGVTFSGIDGAVTWVWVEGESYTTNPAPGWDMSSGGIGMSGNNNDAVVCGVATTFECPGIVWDFTIPMTMTNAKMYAKCSEYFPSASRPYSINKNGQVLGYIGSTQGDWGTWKCGIYWNESTYDAGNSSLGTLNQGNVTFTLKETVYNAMAFDGFFITNGVIDLSEANMPRTAVGADGTSWMQRPTFGSLPTLTGAVTPVVSGMPAGATYFINGVESPSGFGTLNAPGTYHLEIRDQGGVKCYAGADFALPQRRPSGFTFSGIDGAVTWVWVEGESYTTNPVPGWDMSSGGAGMSGNKGNQRACGVATCFECPGIVWDFTIPTTMTNAKMYAKCSEYFPHTARPYSINKDGQLLGYIGSTQGDWGTWKNGDYWAESTYDSGVSNLGTLNQGNVTLVLKETVYNAMVFDGFFITNGTIDLSEANMPRTALGSDGTSWMQTPTFVSLPVFTEPVTPVVNGLPTDVSYFINGVEFPGGFGTLSESGTYNLEIRDLSGKICYAGASFIIPKRPSQNAAFSVPAIPTINVDGNISDWQASTDWSQEYILWNDRSATLTSHTKAKFAWNDASDMLYVAIQTDEASAKAGGHAVIGVSTDIDNIARNGEGATQLAFDVDTVTGGNAVKIMNEIDYFAEKYNHSWLGWHSGIQGVRAACVYANGIWTYEIAIPLWNNWVTMAEKKALTVGDVVYLYGIMESAVDTGNGTNMTYSGNPSFAFENGFYPASALTLVTGPTSILGDANHDNMVDVGDLGILAANYGGTGKAWSQGDFNGDTLVDVGDLGILAAHYGQGATNPSSFSEDYAKAFGTTMSEDDSADDVNSSFCSGLGLPLIIALAMFGLMLVKLEE